MPDLWLMSPAWKVLAISHENDEAFRVSDQGSTDSPTERAGGDRADSVKAVFGIK